MRLILSTLTKPRTSSSIMHVRGMLESSSGAALRTCQDGYPALVAPGEESASLDGMVPNMAIIASGSIGPFEGVWRLFERFLRSVWNAKRGHSES